MSLINLNSSGLSIKLKKILEIDGAGDKYLIAKLSSADIDGIGNIYIIDAKQNSILKFNKNGEFLKKGGRKGEGPGEFIGTPYHIKCSEGNVYVGLRNNRFSGIFVFNANLKYLNQINYNKRVSSLNAFDKHLYIPNLLDKKAFTFDILGESGNYIYDKNFDSLKFPIIYVNKKEISVDKKGNMYILSNLEDKIEKWNKEYVKIWSKFLFSGQKIKYTEGPDGYSLPLKSFWNNKIAMDNSENIYILSGNIARHSKRDVYVISKTGKLLTIFTLPIKTHRVFRIDKNNNLYVDDLYNEETALIKYKILFNSKKIKLDPKGFPAIKKGGMLSEYINAKNK